MRHGVPDRVGDRAGELEIDVAGERLVLLPERAVLWPAEATLLVADAHLGKAATFRAAGVAVPGGTTADALRLLDRLIARTGAGRVVFLGDLFHAREGRTPAMRSALSDWRTRHAEMDVVLVRGNHDRRAGDPDPSTGISCVDAPLVVEPFALRHHPDPTPGAYTLAGHIHPAVRLYGPARQAGRLPCFWFTPDVGILPAFGPFTGAAEVRPRPDDRVFVVAGDEVLPVS